MSFLTYILEYALDQAYKYSLQKDVSVFNKSELGLHLTLRRKGIQAAWAAGGHRPALYPHTPSRGPTAGVGDKRLLPPWPGQGRSRKLAWMAPCFPNLTLDSPRYPPQKGSW